MLKIKKHVSNNKVCYLEEWADQIKPIFRENDNYYFLKNISLYDLTEGNFVGVEFWLVDKEQFDFSNLEFLVEFSIFCPYTTYNFPKITLLKIYSYILESFENDFIADVEAVMVYYMDAIAEKEYEGFHKAVIHLYKKKE
jgi:hypothetical protein